jgi:hypothetical protein
MIHPPETHRVVFTRPGELVSSVELGGKTFRGLMSGGCLDDLLGRIESEPKPTKEQLAQKIIAEQPARLVEQGVDPQWARRFVMRYVYGGAHENEVWRLIKERYALPFGTAPEVVHVSWFPPTRWFRNAWRRKAEGGMWWIDLDAAKQQHYARVVDDLLQYNEQERVRDLRESLLHETNGPALILVDADELRRRIRAATSLAELYDIWPDGLPRLMLEDEPSLRPCS